MFFYIFFASFFVSLVSLVGLFFYKNIEKHVFFWVSFASGVLLSSAFVSLIPEASEEDNDFKISFLNIC